MESHDRSKRSFERKDHQPSASRGSGRPTRKPAGESGERSYDRKPKTDGSGQRSGRPSDRKPREGGSAGERSYDRKPREGGASRSGERSYDRKPREGGSGRTGERSYDRKPREGGSSGERSYDRKPREGGSGERSYDRKPREGGSGERSYDRKPREGGSGRPGERSFDRKPREGGAGRTGERSYDRKPREGGFGRSNDRGFDRGGSGRSGGRPTDRPFHRRREEREELIPRTEDQKIYDGPPIPDEVKLADLDKNIMRQLHGLPEKLADRIARHLVMAAHLMETDPETAYRHALAARARAARVGVVREACGETAYAAGKWSEALSELRAAKRLTGAVDYVPVMADCERALGRPKKAIEMDTPAVRKKMDSSTNIEMSIVVAGARADMGQYDAGLRLLEREPLNSSDRSAPIARLRYAYADMLLKAGRKDEAIEWFHRTVGIDANDETEAEDRLRELGA